MKKKLIKELIAALLEVKSGKKLTSAREFLKEL